MGEEARRLGTTPPPPFGSGYPKQTLNWSARKNCVVCSVPEPQLSSLFSSLWFRINFVLLPTPEFFPPFYVCFPYLSFPLSRAPDLVLILPSSIFFSHFASFLSLSPFLIFLFQADFCRLSTSFFPLDLLSLETRCPSATY